MANPVETRTVKDALDHAKRIEQRETFPYDAKDQRGDMVLLAGEVKKLMAILREVMELSSLDLHTKNCVWQRVPGNDQCDCWFDRAQKIIGKYESN